MLYQPKLHDKIASPDAFVLLKPDVFFRGLLFQVLNFLKAHDLVIVRYLAGQVSESHYKLMYANNFCWNVDDWHHNRKIYAFGPALGLLLRSEKSENALGLLNRLKGSTLPKHREEGSLRKKFQSKSRIFNLIHVPDQHEQAEREAIHWFGNIECKEAQTSLEIIAKEMMLTRYCKEKSCQLDPEYAFLKAKIRLLHALKNKGTVSEQLHDLFSQASHFYHRWSTKVLNTAECDGIEGTILPEWQRKEKILLEKIVRSCQGDPERLTALNIFSDLPACSRFPSNFFWILDEWNVYLSELEQYLIVSRLKYNPVLSQTNTPLD